MTGAFNKPDTRAKPHTNKATFFQFLGYAKKKTADREGQTDEKTENGAIGIINAVR